MRGMHEDPLPRQPSERTGRHYCLKCLAEVPTEAYFHNEQVCDACAAKDEYPLESTPEVTAKARKPKAGG